MALKPDGDQALGVLKDLGPPRATFVRCSEGSSKTASIYFDWSTRCPYGSIV
jgi:hypothetical protein